MLKGVNRQVLEVTNTESPYFERIIFYVKPEYTGADRAKLKKEAEALALKSQKPPKARRSKREIGYLFLQSGLCLAAGIAITFLLNYIV